MPPSSPPTPPGLPYASRTDLILDLLLLDLFLLYLLFFLDLEFLLLDLFVDDELLVRPVGGLVPPAVLHPDVPRRDPAHGPLGRREPVPGDPDPTVALPVVGPPDPDVIAGRTLPVDDHFMAGRGRRGFHDADVEIGE